MIHRLGTLQIQDMINLDLAYLKDWSKRWLVKFNQNKTEIMVFSTRDTKLYFNFDFEGTSLRDVELHKHLVLFLVMTVSGPNILINL